MDSYSEPVILSKAPWLKVGVVSDTHVPDRAAALHPDLVAALEAEDVDLIFHLGDISIPAVVKTLEEIAPVYAVRGNRDLFYGRALPRALRLKLNGTKTTLLHGQGGLADYVIDKWFYLRQGYAFERYERVLLRLAPQARVIIFGHTHRPETRWEQDRLFFNPGAAANPGARKLKPTFGILWYHSEGYVEGKIIPLDGAQLINRRWRRDG